MDYDLIVSLGGSCAVAYQLQCRDLRKVAAPFDWLFSTTPSVMGALADCIENDFAAWMQFDQLETVHGAAIRAGGSPYQYRDKVTGYQFVHDFSKPIDEATFKEVKEKYSRRIAVWCHSLQMATSIALCYDSELPGAEKEIIKVKNAILRKYGTDKRIDCFIWEFKAPEYKIGLEDGVRVARFTHPRHTFMYHHLSFEFEIMDDWRFTDLFRPDGRMKGKRIYVLRKGHLIRVWLFRYYNHGFEVKVRVGSRHFELLFGTRKVK